ncbi:MAG TPA: ribosomal protein S18-alanine N-acetyltransferase [Terriglobales bacterium]|nr:ribosomal protein S18-alanine N-acetyltransferase [Terriglobales bacterium]
MCAPPGDSLRIRAAAAGDIPRLLELSRQSAFAAWWSEKKYEQCIGGSSGWVLVGEIGAEIVGFAVASIAAGECEIENIAIAPQHRARGCGSKLLAEVIARAGRQGCRAIWLEVRESNEAARRLYSRAGFAAAGRRRHYYRDPAEDALILKLTL